MANKKSFVLRIDEEVYKAMEKWASTISKRQRTNRMAGQSATKSIREIENKRRIAFKVRQKKIRLFFTSKLIIDFIQFCPGHCGKRVFCYFNQQNCFGFIRAIFPREF